MNRPGSLHRAASLFAATIVATLSMISISPAQQAFASPEEATAFLKYRPFGLSVAGKRLRLAEVRRNEADWHEQPITVVGARWSYLESLGQTNLPLERATRALPIDYEWRLGNTASL